MGYRKRLPFRADSSDYSAGRNARIRQKAILNYRREYLKPMSGNHTLFSPGNNHSPIRRPKSLVHTHIVPSGPGFKTCSFASGIP